MWSSRCTVRVTVFRIFVSGVTVTLDKSIRGNTCVLFNTLGKNKQLETVWNVHVLLKMCGSWKKQVEARDDKRSSENADLFHRK